MSSVTSSFSIHRAVLPSGLRVLILPMAGTRTVTFFLAVRTGSRNEVARAFGVSHFLEHLVFKGSKKRPSTKEISEAVDRVGGEMNAFTSKEWTAFYAKAASRHAELIVDVISDMVLKSRLDPKEIDRERGVVIEEMNMYEDTPMRSIGEFFEESLYGRHALAHPIIGTKHSVSAMPKTIIARYRERQYRSRTAVACLAGDIDPAEGFRLLRHALKEMPRGTATASPPFGSAFGPRRVRVKAKSTDQTHVIIGSPTVPYLHRDRPAVDLLATILGGGMSSRLFLEVRERRGLAYAVRTSPEYFVDTGYVATQAGVDTSKLLEACRVIVREHARVCESRVPASELQKARDFVKGKLLLALEASDEVAQFAVLQEVLLNRIMMPDDYFRLLDAVLASDLQRVARRYLRPRHLRLAVIGPSPDERALARTLRESP